MATGEQRVGTEVGGRYRVESLLGEGGFASVYRAVHMVTGMTVALKVLHPFIKQIDGGTERFIRETQLIAALNHPHIVRILDAGFETDGTGYASFELLRGETLGDLLGRHQKLTPREIAPIACDVLHALAAAHRRDVVHRDIKPENIFLARDHDDRLVTKVLDFGIAYAEVANDGSRKLTQVGMLLGSPTYMAPEQAAGDPVSAATDIWAVGVVLFEALTGDVPFTGLTAMDVLKQIVWQPAPPVPDHVPKPLAAVITRAMAKRPEDRYVTADAMTAAIESALGTSIPPGARPPSRRERTPAGGFDADLDALVADVKAAAPSTPGSLAATAAELTFTSVPAPPMDPPAQPAPVASRAVPPRSAAPRNVLPEVRVVRPASVIHTPLTPEVVDRTRVTVRRRIAISAGGALLAVVAVTGAILSGGYRVARSGGPAGGPGTAHSLDGTGLETDETALGTAAHGHGPRPEITTPVAVGEQLRLALPQGLDRAATLQFVDHLVTPIPGTGATRLVTRPVTGARAPTGSAPGVGFATCAGERVYVHPGGVAGVMRVASVTVSCDGPSLAFAPDLDGDRLPDLVAVDRRHGGLVVVSTRGIAVVRRVNLPGARAVTAGLVLDRGEAGAVAYVPRDGGGGDLVAVGLRRGRVAWRSDRALAVGDPQDDGLGVGPDADGDHLPDVVVGTVVHGRRCVELLSGATGARLWRAARCVEGGGMQSVSLGPDINDDGRGDVSVGGGGRVRLLSGADGGDLRVVTASDDQPFGLPAMLVPDLARDGFADVLTCHLGAEHPTVELYSGNDGHRVGTWALPRGAAPPHVRVQYAENFAFPGGRSVVVGTPEGGISVVAAGLASERRTDDASGP